MIRFFLVTVLAGSIAIWTLVGYLADRSVDRAVSRDAIDKALHWGDYMSVRIPDLETLIETGVLSADQKRAIRQIRLLGDVFRFKLFDAEGRLVLISDESFISDPSGISTEFDPESLQVANTGVAIVDVFDGSEKVDRPDLYAEAYVPLKNEDGVVFGVSEVYVNETKARDYFAESFEGFGLLVSTLSALLFLGPGLAYVAQREAAQRSRTEAEYLAKFDSLTGLLNRAEFTKRAEEMVAERRLSALFFIDADRFKAINDNHGHAVGDELLAHIGRVLTANTDTRDLVSRFGGDEFVVAMCRAEKDVLMRRIRRILSLCSAPITIGDRQLSSSVSIGIALLGDDETLDTALANADAALYSAKSAGRNQYAFYGDDMGEQIRRRNALETRIKTATEREEFTIDYQPLVEGQSHKIFGYEALLRLKDDNGKSIPPNEFIPLAEDMGLIEEIGSWTLSKATRDMADFEGDPCVAVNLSAAQFRSGRLPGIVADALEQSGLPASRLEFEITESLLLSDNPSIEFQMDALRDMGIKIAMDDFGTGFSSLGYLWRYGFDRLKIDQSFVSGMNDSPERSLEIIESVIMLGKRLDMQVTAEGVETVEQSEALADLGCDVLQGFLFGHPERLPGSDRNSDTVTSKRKRATG